jgi:hypothetical protein
LPTATIIGGDYVQLSLNPAEIHAARDALAALGGSFSTGKVLHNRSTPPGTVPGALYVYNFAGGGGPFALPTAAGGEALTGNKGLSITGHAGEEVLIGNQGPDTINAGGGFGTIISGDGGSHINVGAGPFFIMDGLGQDTVKLTGGSDTVVSLGGPDLVKIKGTNLTFTGAVNVVGAGNDTIKLLGRPTTVTEAGSATVARLGSFSLFFDAHKAKAGSFESVTAGSGSSTMLGGHGTNVFIDPAGYSSMVAGSGSTDTFAGGSGDSFMDADHAANVVFQFDSSHAGGFHTIAHFTHGKDTIDLQGYTSGDAHITTHAGNTIINLDHGATRIVLKGFTGLDTSTDIKFT